MSGHCPVVLPLQFLVVIVVGPQTVWNMDCTSKFPKNNIMCSYIYTVV